MRSSANGCSVAEGTVEEVKTPRDGLTGRCGGQAAGEHLGDGGQRPLVPGRNVEVEAQTVHFLVEGDQRVVTERMGPR